MAGVPARRGWGSSRSLRSPCRFCAPGPGRDGNRPGSSDTWGSQSSRSRRHPPHPQSLQEVFVFASAPGSFSFTFLFARGWDSGWKAPRGIPADSLTAFEVLRPPGGNWVAAPSRLRWLSPPTLQPGLNGGTELGFSALGGEWWWLKGRWYFPPESLRPGPLPAPALPSGLPNWPGCPALSWGKLSRNFSFWFFP